MVSITGQLSKVLLRPVVTEKSTRLQEANKYTFQVALGANRTQVKLAVEQFFKVKVLKVNMVRTPGKAKRFGPRLVRTPERKKAIVTLKPGDKIALFEGV
jgi:large subunit ribosomal protein L23